MEGKCVFGRLRLDDENVLRTLTELVPFYGVSKRGTQQGRLAGRRRVW